MQMSRAGKRKLTHSTRDDLRRERGGLPLKQGAVIPEQGILCGGIQHDKLQSSELSQDRLQARNTNNMVSQGIHGVEHVGIQ